MTAEHIQFKNSGLKTTTRRRITLGIVLAAVLLMSVAVWLKVRDGKAFSDTRALLSRFPAEEGVVLSINFGAARASGFLSESKTAPEPEYKQFLAGTGFNYRKDLDSVTASFSKSGNFFIARGRFDWQRLREYAVRQGGSCYEQLCRMPGSTPERHISFLPLRDDTLGLAVSNNDLAATSLTKQGDPVTSSIPEAPVWISVSGAALRQPAAFPSGLHFMLSALTRADRVVITVAPSGKTLTAKMEATCRTPDDARILASQLRTMTATLKESAVQNQQVSNDELARLLLGGTFDESGTHVNGQWPFDKGLIASLTSGI
jgi:hypothetical protein